MGDEDFVAAYDRAVDSEGNLTFPGDGDNSSYRRGYSRPIEGCSVGEEQSGVLIPILGHAGIRRRWSQEALTG